jgi:hypothetical protein
MPGTVDPFGRPIAADLVQPVDLAGYPNAVRIGENLFPFGVTHMSLGRFPDRLEVHEGTPVRPFRMPDRTRAPEPTETRPGDPALGGVNVPVFADRRLMALPRNMDFDATKAKVYTSLRDAAQEWSSATTGASLADSVRQKLQGLTLGSVFEFFPVVSIEEALSPIGVAHYYRQLYFNLDEGVGPLEQAFTIAPLETLEVVYETVRRQIHEEQLEVGSETVSETATETKNLDEVSDKVSSLLQRDNSASVSVSAGANAVVWQASASAQADMSVSSQRSREETSRRLKEVTSRASERITKTFTLRVRDVEDITTTNMTRRIIRNESDEPVSYGLRRVLRKVRVKVQDLGPRLVWQLYLRNPGEGLARSRFVHFREAEPISVPEVPPGVRPRPRGGIDTGSSSATLQQDGGGWYVNLVIQPGPDRRVRSVQIDSLTDLEGGGKDDKAPSPVNSAQWDTNWDEATNTFSSKIRVARGDSSRVSLTYTYQWDPAGRVLDEWEAERAAAVRDLTETHLEEQFQRQKTLITERSKIRPRPAMELRREERYEVMNRMVSHLFARGDDPSDVTPLEIEYFHRFFDLEAMFVYTHPSWWRPRYTPVASGLQRPAYEITAESEPAPLGSSLGWMIQLDGDNRRNEFINSPWVRVCIPMRLGRERAAIQWLARHIEGEIGYDLNRDPLKRLLDEIETRAQDEQSVGYDGPNFVTIETEPVDLGGGAPLPEGPLEPEHLYPVSHEFDVTVPTEGFVYDKLVISGGIGEIRPGDSPL